MNFLPFYKQLIAMRKAHPALQQGETEWVANGAPERVLSFIRRAAGEEYFVAINVSNQPYAGVAEVPNGEYVDQTPGLEEAARKKATLPGADPQRLGLPHLSQSSLIRVFALAWGA